MLPTIQRHAPNFTKVSIGDLTVWYSYDTPIAFRSPSTGLVARRNDWGPTTGGHLGVGKNECGVGVPTKDRVTPERFAELWEQAIGGMVPA